MTGGWQEYRVEGASALKDGGGGATKSWQDLGRVWAKEVARERQTASKVLGFEAQTIVVFDVRASEFKFENGDFRLRSADDRVVRIERTQKMTTRHYRLTCSLG